MKYVTTGHFHQGRKLVPITDTDCKPTPPTPPPTPPPQKYFCNTTVGQCAMALNGTQTAADCIASCKCVPINNCGQWNATGIISCGKNITTLNVCEACNLPYLTPGPSQQDICDKCVATPTGGPSGGCGGNKTASAHQHVHLCGGRS